MMKQLLTSLIALIVAGPASTSPLDNALRDFAFDVSGGNSVIMQQVEEIIANPPTKLEEIGFYGAENKPADERKFRAVIFRLGEGGFIFGFEDKYISEMPLLLVDNGWIAAQPDTGTFIGKLEEAYIDENPKAPTIAANMLRKDFGAHVRNIESAAVKAGRALLYVDLPLGDTFHLISLPVATAEKWRDVVFVTAASERFAVTAPQWDIYYDFLTYALLLDTPTASPVSAYSRPLKPLSQIGYVQ